jgi:RimJ/RimL family protein N-acetyltransferase
VTPRIRLLPATLAHLEALERDRAEFAALVGSPAPDGWPEFPEGIAFTRERLTEHPEQGEWWMQFFLDATDGTLVGSGGFVGPPRDREVEIGYEVAPAHRGRGYGAAAAAAMVEKARASGEVDAVIAHTLAADTPSSRLLARLDFVRVAELDSDEDGRIWRWRLS